MRRWLPVLAVLLLAACAGTQKKPGAPTAAGVPVSGAATAGATPVDCTGFVPYPTMQEDPATRGDYVAGGLYKPGVSDSTPDYLPRVDCIREPDVVALPRSAYGNRSPYKVLGKSYEVLGATDGYVETGLASYYGNKFHGRRTSNHEVYDMYAFTAAHKSLPLPSFARVTNLENGRSVVVRVNDRGPFHDGRVVDLSYAAAVKLDIHRRGTGRVEVRALQPGEIPPGALPSSALPRAQAAVAAPAKASGMDSLVGTLPKGAAAMPVMLAEPGDQFEAGRVYVMAEGIGVRAGSERMVFANDDGTPPFAALRAADSAAILLSGADMAHVDVAVGMRWAGGLALGQSPHNCFDATASNALVARGGEAKQLADISRQLTERWPA